VIADAEAYSLPGVFWREGSANTISVSIVIISGEFHAGGSAFSNMARDGSPVHPHNTKASAKMGKPEHL
jgi:hypothetical protein